MSEETTVDSSDDSSTELPNNNVNNISVDGQQQQYSNPMAISTILANVQPSIRDFLVPIMNLNDGGKYFEPTCPFCRHASRDGAEILYRSLPKTDTNRMQTIENYFLQDIGNPLSIDVIRNHINNHMDRGDAEYRKAEYINKLSMLSSVEMTTFQRIKIALAAITERITTMHSCATGGKLELEEKKSKVINELTKTWTNLVSLQSELMGEMIGKGEVITIPKDDFNRILGNAMQNAKTDNEKIIISNLLTEFENCGLNKT
jgi:hypothetical protein